MGPQVLGQVGERLAWPMPVWTATASAPPGCAIGTSSSAPANTASRAASSARPRSVNAANIGSVPRSGRSLSNEQIRDRTGLAAAGARAAAQHLVADGRLVTTGERRGMRCLLP